MGQRHRSFERFPLWVAIVYFWIGVALLIVGLVLPSVLLCVVGGACMVWSLAIICLKNYERSGTPAWLARFDPTRRK